MLVDQTGIRLTLPTLLIDVPVVPIAVRRRPDEPGMPIGSTLAVR